jgi:hypothetical protein
MFENIDSLRKINLHWGLPCVRHELCLDNECVWPGDFDNNGIVNHEDYLAWGALNGETGGQRNGLISWRGHYSEEWEDAWYDVNARHADGDGNGEVDLRDIEVHRLNHLLVNDNYHPQSHYPLGDDIILSADQGFSDRIRNLQVKTRRPIDNVLGISYEIEFDTALFEQVNIHSFQPDVTNGLIYNAPIYKRSYYPYAFVQSNQQNISIEEGFIFSRSVIYALQLRPGKTAPDSTTIRLRNLKAIDSEGNDLNLGSQPLIVYRDGFVSNSFPGKPYTEVYPIPASDELYILTSEQTECMIYDLHGRLVLQKTISERGDSFRVADLAPGLYVLQVTATGETLKLVIQ